MARSRFIRPEFFSDEKVGELPFGARLLFQSIWCQSDLRGVFELSAKQLRVSTFPFDEGLTSAQVQEWLTILEQKGMIGCFEAAGKLWGYVKHWSKHQAISGREVDIDSRQTPAQRRPSPPGCAQHVPRDDPGCAAAPSPSPSPTLSPTPSPPSPGREDIPTTAAAAHGLTKTIETADPGLVRKAIHVGSLAQLLNAYGIPTADAGEITRDANGAQLGEILAILDWRLAKEPVQRASGFRVALGEWRALDIGTRKRVAKQVAIHFGLMPGKQDTP